MQLYSQKCLIKKIFDYRVNLFCSFNLHLPCMAHIDKNTPYQHNQLLISCVINNVNKM